MLAAPVADFRKELSRILLPEVRFKAVTETSLAADLSDLRTALQSASKSSNELARISGSYESARTKLKEFQEQVEAVRNDAEPETDAEDNVIPRNPASALFPDIAFDADLPAEFVDYFKGLTIWRNPNLRDKQPAREAWEKLLSRPPEQRRFKSTWAAYMLAKSWEDESPSKAVAYYWKVRELANAGFSDSLGLAAASLGWEARLCLSDHNFQDAIELYLQHMATGDASAETSLIFTMRQFFRDPAVTAPSYAALAKNPLTRQVVTAYIISTRALKDSMAINASDEASSNRVVQLVNDWLAANKQAGIKDVGSAEALALASYQNGQWDSTEFWIGRAGNSPVAQWLKAKLLFRAGKVYHGETVLANVAPQFPLETADANGVAPAELKDNLGVPDSYALSAAYQLRGELGVCHLTQGQYVQALDDFMRAGLWIDAAYVAERVLTVDELKAYVDGQGGQALRNYAPPANNQNSTEDESSRPSSGEKLRYLLARRLTRTIRGDEARPYYPTDWQTSFDQLAEALLTGWNESLSQLPRARALFKAAVITRESGMELLGTEVGPDWRVYGGSFEGTLSAEWRKSLKSALFPPSSDELARAGRHGADPDARFHYRYQAAFLGWAAAKLMPDNSAEAAHVLWSAGTWLKDRDPATADIFYKALVRRCGRTPLGAEADHIRWFPLPLTDDNGETIPPDWSLEADIGDSAESNPLDGGAAAVASDYPVPGQPYAVHAGDTLLEIARAASVWGVGVTVEDILAANPDLDSNSLAIGQRIRIPITAH